MRNQSLWVLGGVWSQGWNLKELTEGHHQAWSLRLNLTQHGETYQVQTWVGLTDWELFLDSVGGGAWPFLVGGVICLVNSVNERDLNLLNSKLMFNRFYFLEGLCVLKHMEVWGNNRSVMPLDVLGRTRATMTDSESIPGPEGFWEIFLIPVVLGIDLCNYRSWTRNA